MNLRGEYIVQIEDRPMQAAKLFKVVRVKDCCVVFFGSILECSAYIRMLEDGYLKI